MRKNETDRVIENALDAKTIAVVGLSKNPSRPSQDVAIYLKSNGYQIVPINPTVDEVIGEKSYESLLDLSEELAKKVEVVDIFRRAEDVPPIVDDAITLRKKYGRLRVVWMQLGIVNEPAAEKAKRSDLEVVMDRCMQIEHARRPIRVR
ncbi:MAG: CoA-binding protein [Candidatus Bathyarchaeia archaeon]